MKIQAHHERRWRRSTTSRCRLIRAGSISRPSPTVVPVRAPACGFPRQSGRAQVGPLGPLAIGGQHQHAARVRVLMTTANRLDSGAPLRGLVEAVRRTPGPRSTLPGWRSIDGPDGSGPRRRPCRQSRDSFPGRWPLRRIVARHERRRRVAPRRSFAGPPVFQLLPSRRRAPPDRNDWSRIGECSNYDQMLVDHLMAPHSPAPRRTARRRAARRRSATRPLLSRSREGGPRATHVESRSASWSLLEDRGEYSQLRVHRVEPVLS